MALVGLQGGNELFHLREGLLVMDGQEHPGFNENKLGRHGHELAGHFQIEFLAPLHPGQILLQDHRDLDILDLHFIFAQKMEDKIKGAGKVLQSLRAGLYHFFQVIDGTVHSALPLSYPSISVNGQEDPFTSRSSTQSLAMANGVLRTPVHRIAIRRSIPHRS